MSDYSIPDENFYSEQEEWVRMDGDVAMIGVTDYAQQQLGDVVFVELPEVGSTINKDEPFGVIESVKAVSDLFSPITGTVAAINEDLANTPERINEDCYSDGWLIKVTPTHEEEFETLLNCHDYTKYLEERD